MLRSVGGSVRNFLDGTGEAREEGVVVVTQEQSPGGESLSERVTQLIAW